MIDAPSNEQITTHGWGEPVAMEDHAISAFITIGDARLYYELAGNGAPIVLLHAGIADSRMWDAQFSELSREFRVLRCDLRGFGQTIPGTGKFTDWQDLARLLETLEIDSAVVVGCSMGARVAAELALARPDLVRTLILVSPGLFDEAPRSEPLLAGWRGIEQALDAGDVDRAIDLEVEMWVDGPARDPDRVDPRIRLQVREMNARAWELEPQTQGREPVEPPAIERLGDIHVPTLVIAGEDDQPDILRIADRLATEIPHARKVVFEQAAHMLSMEHPSRLNRELREFLASQS